ncbi:glycosyl hydrolase family 28-related protein [Paenibacillus sp. GCM10027626]|uniref:glycosyl hydrolase family 28-related protein n=1 Tax=Paenibacillus sp. GCM10027626 TaxID=3273411 RepID=UPI003644D073
MKGNRKTVFWILNLALIVSMFIVIETLPATAKASERVSSNTNSLPYKVQYDNIAATNGIGTMRKNNFQQIGASGTVLELAVANDGSTANKYVYSKISNKPYTFQAGDYIEYDVKLFSNIGDAGGIEIYTMSGTPFRDLSGWRDQNGIVGHPERDLSGYAYNKWFHRKLQVPPSMIGQTSAHWDIVGENNNHSIRYKTQYDNIVVTDGNGTVRSVIFRDAADYNASGDVLVSGVTSASVTTVNIGSVLPAIPAGDVLDFQVKNGTGTPSKYAYKKFSNASYTFVPGDYVEYDVMLYNAIDGSGGIEIYNTDNTFFRDITGWRDQNALRGHPAETISANAFAKWFHRKLEVPAAMVGKTASQWFAAGENDSDSLSYRALYDNIVISDINGIERFKVFKEASDYNATGDMNSSGISSSTISISAYSEGTVVPAVVTPVNATEDVVVAGVTVTNAPYNADNTGEVDSSAAIQAAIDDVYNAGGGVVWMPAGKYKINYSIQVRNHVTLRGDWRDPDSGSGSYGTLIMAYAGKNGGQSDPGLFRIWGSAGVNGLTVYYPEQSAAAPVSYPSTFEILGRSVAEDGYMCGAVQNVTLLNSYFGVISKAHEMHTIRNVKGTALMKGLALYDSADVSEVEKVWFKPNYWADLDASVSSVKPSSAQIAAWTRANATGMELSGLEWDSFNSIHLSDFKVGVDVIPSWRSFNGHLFDVHVENSNIGLRIDNIPEQLGMVIANSSFKANQGSNPVAVRINSNNATAIQFNNSVIGGGASNAVQLAGDALANFQNCTFDDWTGTYALVASKGTLAVEGSTFTPSLSSTKKGVQLQDNVSSAVLLGNDFTGAPGNLLDNASAGDVKRQDTGYTLGKSNVGSYPYKPNRPKPASSRLYNVKDYGAAGNSFNVNPAIDDTNAIQSALDAAGSAGGGTVYIPAGIYKIAGHLNVPAGVELRGSDDSPHRVAVYGPATGTILYAYEGKNTADPDTAPPFILLNGANAGVRGLSVHYPEQATDNALNIAAYPWTIRGAGSGIYAMDVSFVNAYKGIDFATNATDNHYINHIGGTVLKEGIRVGNSTEGWVENCLFNITYWGRAYGLPGNLEEGSMMFPVAGSYVSANLNAYTVTGGAQNEHMLNTFVFNSKNAFTFESTANATVLNSASDYRGNAIQVKGTSANGVKMVNFLSSSFIDGSGGSNALSNSGGIISVYNWNTKDDFNYALDQSGGTTFIQGASFAHNTARVAGGSATVNGVYFRDSGTQANVGSGAEGNFWGNIGGNGFNVHYAGGSSGMAAFNIRR